MNSKKNSGWILCPSKSFPGQFYYFNVVNGETAWSLNDAEKKILRKGESIQKMDKSHCYPEPSHPPDDATSLKPIGQAKPVFGQTKPVFGQTESEFVQPEPILGQRKPVFSETKRVFGQQNLRNGQNEVDNRIGQSLFMQHQMPTFGQEIFPKMLPMPIPQISNIIWTPMQIQVPTAFITSQTNQENYENLIHKSPDRDLLVETCNRPLCERFINYEKPIIKFSKENKVINKTHETSPNKSPILPFQNDQSEINFSLSKMKSNDQRCDTKTSTNKNLGVIVPKPLIREEILKTPEQLSKNNYEKIPSKSYNFSKREILPKANIFKESKKHLFQNSVTKYEDISQEKNLFEMKSADDNSQNYKQKYLFQTMIDENSTLFQGNTELNRFQSKDEYLNPTFDAFDDTLRRSNKVEIHPNQFLSPQGNSVNRVLQSESAENSTLYKGSKVGIEPNECPTLQGNSTKGVLQTTSTADNEDKLKSNHFKTQRDEKSTLFRGDKCGELTLDKNDLRNVLLARRQKTAVVRDPIVTDRNTELNRFQSKDEYLNPTFDAFDDTLRRSNKVEIHPNQFLSPQGNSVNRVLQSESAENSTLYKGSKVGIEPNECPTLQGNSTKGVLQTTSTADNEDKLKSNHFKTQRDEKSTLFRGDKCGELTLDKNDLRNVLLARRQKTAVVRDPIVTDNKTITKEPISKPVTAKKVTFKLDHEKDPEPLSDITSDPISIEDNHASKELKKLAPPSVGNECWYIAVDTDVLLEEIKFLDSFVRLHLKCRLLIPSRVMSDIIALSRGECRESRVTLARHCVRLLATPQPHIIVGNTVLDDNANMSAPDSILRCCLATKERNHVVLITNDKSLQSTAKSLNIHTFTAQEIKDGAAQKLNIQFDIKKLKISIPNDQENEKIFAETEEAPSNTLQKKLFDGISCNNAFDNENVLTKTQTNNRRENDSGTNESTNIAKFINYKLTSKDQPDLFPIQKNVIANATQVKDITNTRQKDQNVQNPNEAVSCYFLNNNDHIEKEVDQNNFDSDPDEEQHIVSCYFQKHKTNDSQNHSIFEINNNKGNNGENQRTSSIFELANDQRVMNQPNNSIFDFANEKSKKKEQPMSSFENVSLKNQEPHNSIFENYDNYNQSNENQINIENRIKDRAEEWICKFRQIMEECLSAVLQKSLSSIPRLMPPPWSLFEALQCIKNVYGDHDTVKNIVETICEKLFDMNSKTDTIKSRIPPKDFVRSIECGLLLVQTLEDIAPTECLTDAESSLYTILRDIENPSADSEECLKTPANYRRDVVKQQENRINFVKDRSEMVNYLKKHFATWQSYDDSLEHKKSPRKLGQVGIKNCTDMTIVRTFGKNLSQLKINNSRTMTITEADKDSDIIIKQININHMKSPVDDDKMTFVRKVNDKITDYNDKNEVTIDQTIKTVGSISKTLNEDSKTEKPYHTGLRLIRPSKKNMRNDLQTGILTQSNAKTMLDKQNITVPKVIRIFEKFQVTKDIQEKPYVDAGNGSLVAKIDPEKNEPKVIRLFNKIEDLKNCTIDKPNFDSNFTTHENTFEQTEDHAGPKVVRHIKTLPAFENKLKIKDSFDLDKLDYSVMSGSENDYFCQSVLNENDNENIISKNDNFKMNDQNNIDKHTENCGIYQDDQSNVKYAHDNAINVINNGVYTICSNDNKNYVKDYKNYAKENEPHSSNDCNTNQSKIQRTINKKYSKDMKVHSTNANTSERHDNENGNNAKGNDSTNNNGIYMLNNASVSNNNYSMDNDNSSTNSSYHNTAYNSYATKNDSYATINNSYETNNNSYATNNDDHALKSDRYAANNESYATHNDSNATHNDSYATKNDKYAKSVKEPLNRDDTTNDSGFENESVHAYALAKLFLSEISCSLKLVHKFIDESIKEIRGNKLKGKKKRLIHKKACETNVKITAIIDRLKSIIEREAIGGSSLKVLLAKAGTEACGDKRMTDYRQVVTKCLEQAQILESALKMILSVTTL